MNSHLTMFIEKIFVLFFYIIKGLCQLLSENICSIFILYYAYTCVLSTFINFISWVPCPVVSTYYIELTRSVEKAKQKIEVYPCLSIISDNDNVRKLTVERAGFFFLPKILYCYCYCTYFLKYRFKKKKFSSASLRGGGPH